MNIEIANRLVELRKKNNLSQEELADKLGLSRQAVSKWERAEASPDTDNLICLAKIYGVSLDDLLNTDQSIEDIAKETKEKQNEKETASENTVKEQVSIGPGHIYVHNDEEHVDIGLGHIHVIDKDGTEVHIGNGHFDCPMEHKKEHKITGIVFLSTFALALTAYLLMGFLLNTSWAYGETNSGWATGWMVFFIPFIASSVARCIIYKKASKFDIALTAVNAYLICGLGFGLWHPTWAILFAIPAFYIVVGNIEKAIAKKKQSNVENN